jgi:hypothetical protein
VGNLVTLRKYSRQGVKLNAPLQSDGARALHLAVRNGHNPCVQHLLANRASPLAVDCKGATALHEAAGLADPSLAADLVGQLLAAVPVPLLRGFVVASTDRGRTALHEATCKGNTVVVATLASAAAGAALDAVDEEQRSALVLALTVCRQDARGAVVRALLAAGANPFAQGVADALNRLRDDRDVVGVVHEAMRDRGCADLVPLLDRWCRGVQDGRLFSDLAALRSKFTRRPDGSMAEEPEAHIAAALERVRTGAFYPVTDTVLESAVGHPHSKLFNALGCLSCPAQCTVDDAKSLLEEYETALVADPTVPMHPLLLLLHARLAVQANSDARLGAALLLEFQRLFTHEVGQQWLTDPECKQALRHLQPTSVSDLLSPLQAAGSAGANVSGGVGAGSGASGPARPGGANPRPKAWLDIAGSLTVAQQAPMEKLLDMTGLRRVKEQALRIYTSVLADKALAERDYRDSINPQTLNFIFSGARPPPPGGGGAQHAMRATSSCGPCLCVGLTDRRSISRGGDFSPPFPHPLRCFAVTTTTSTSTFHQEIPGLERQLWPSCSRSCCRRPACVRGTTW